MGARDPRPVRAAGVAFFFKQWGGLRPKTGGRKLDGREWNQFPKPSPFLRCGGRIRNHRHASARGL